MIGGGLGAQPMPAQVAYEFLPEDQIIPFAEAVLRLFDRHGERSKRFKARFKFLLKEWGLEKLMAEVEAERKALPYPNYPISQEGFEEVVLPSNLELPKAEIADQAAYKGWLATNVQVQKQSEYRSVSLKVRLGDITTPTARLLASLVDEVAADDLRLTINQGIVLRYVLPEHLPYLYQQLSRLGLADAGFDSTLDITACPGTDTCNLGINNLRSIRDELKGDFDYKVKALNALTSSIVSGNKKERE